MNKAFFLTGIMTVLLCGGQVFSQAKVKKEKKPRPKQAFVLFAGGGAGNYVSPVPQAPTGTQYNTSRTGFSGTFRVMWHPGYRLNVGLESGYTKFYSYSIKNGTKPGNVRLDAIPIMIVWSMPIVKRVNIFAGLGSYLLTTRLQYDGAVKSKSTSLGSNIAISYTMPLAKNVNISAEAKWMNAYVTKDDVLSLQVLMAWKIFK